MAKLAPKIPQYVRQRGASLVEYCLLLSLIAFVCVASISYLGENIRGKYLEMATALEGHSSSSSSNGGGTEIIGGPGNNSGGK